MRGVGVAAAALLLAGCAAGAESSRFTAAEQDFLRLVHSDDHSDDRLVSLGHSACDTFRLADDRYDAYEELILNRPTSVERELYSDILDRAADTLCPKALDGK